MTAEQTYCDLVVDALDVLNSFAEVKVETKTSGITFTIKVMLGIQEPPKLTCR